MNNEIVEAVGTIKEKSEELGYHISGMVTFGVSAGGTLAMNLAYSSKSPIPVKFVFQLAAPTYFDSNNWKILIKVDKLNSKEEFLYMMTGEDLSMENWKRSVDRISPSTAVKIINPVPSFIGYG